MEGKLTYAQRRYIEVVNHRVLKLIDSPYDDFDIQKYKREYQILNNSVSRHLHLERDIKDLKFDFIDPLTDFSNLLSRDLQKRNNLVRRMVA